ncbi:MAG: hypothetical protein J6J97_07200 [Akkermansia sp.]|nr:hypothetical protein [Akkermansia sp.]
MNNQTPEIHKMMEAMGFYHVEDGNYALRNFSLKINFDGKMSPKVLKSAASGLDNMLTVAARILSDATEQEIILAGISVNTVQAGSCEFDKIELITKIVSTIKDMDYKTVLTICLSGLACFSIYWFSQYQITKLEADSRTETPGLITVKDSTISITESLNNQYPGNEETVDKIVQAIVNLYEKSPRVMRKFARGLTEISHPGEIEPTNVQFSSDNNQGKQTTHTLLTEEQIQLVPDKMPPEEKSEPEPELCKNVQIAIIKIDTESNADSAIQCRIIDEDYSNKKCSLIIHEAAQKQEIMNRFPKNVNVNLYALKQLTPNGETKLKAYVLKDILN